MTTTMVMMMTTTRLIRTVSKTRTAKAMPLTATTTWAGTSVTPNRCNDSLASHALFKKDFRLPCSPRLSCSSLAASCACLRLPSCLAAAMLGQPCCPLYSRGCPVSPAQPGPAQLARHGPARPGPRPGPAWPGTTTVNTRSTQRSTPPKISKLLRAC